MIRFIIRRLLGMVAVLFAISVVTFAIFNVIPNGDPALRLAGHSATPATVAAIRRQWGFDKPVYVQYVRTMEKILTGSLISYSTQTNVDQEIGHDLGPTLSLAIGAALLWMFFALCLGLYTAMRAGKVARPLADGARAGRDLDAGLLGRRADELLPRLQGRDLPQRRLHEARPTTRSSGPTT